MDMDIEGAIARSPPGAEREVGVRKTVTLLWMDMGLDVYDGNLLDADLSKSG